MIIEYVTQLTIRLSDREFLGNGLKLDLKLSMLLSKLVELLNSLIQTLP